MKSFFAILTCSLILLQFARAATEESPTQTPETLDEVVDSRSFSNEEVEVFFELTQSAEADHDHAHDEDLELRHPEDTRPHSSREHGDEHEHLRDNRIPSAGKPNLDATHMHELRREVEAEFEQQQHRQIRQLELLRSRLEAIEHRVESRRHDREQIIERRLQQTLNQQRKTGRTTRRPIQVEEFRREADRELREQDRQVVLREELQVAELRAQSQQLQAQHEQLTGIREKLMRQLHSARLDEAINHELIEARKRDQRLAQLKNQIAEYRDFLDSLEEQHEGGPQRAQMEEELSRLEARLKSREKELKSALIAERKAKQERALKTQRSKAVAEQMQAIERGRVELQIRQELVDEEVELRMRRVGEVAPIRQEGARSRREVERRILQQQPPAEVKDKPVVNR